MTKLPAALAIALTVAAPAAAAPTVRQQDVAVTATDLADAKARTKLEKRLDAAAREVCYLGSTSDRKGHAAAMRCYRATRDATMAELASAGDAAGDCTISVRSR